MTFKDKIAAARKILLVNPRGLGDIIHSLPLAAMLKQTVPAAQIDMLVSSHSESLFPIVPYVGDVFSVPHYPRARNRWERYQRRLKVGWKVRRKAYDAIINLQAIDSTLATIALSRARHRLALRNMSMPVGMPWYYTDVVDRRWANQSAYQFMLDSMTQAGFETAGWHLGPHLLNLSSQQLPAGVREPFFHFSPFTSKTSRQLPIAEAQAMITGLLQRYPQHQLLVSCAAVRREVDEIHAMIPPPLAGRVQVFAGSLDLAQLALVLSRAEAHLGPDTGSLHLAWLSGAKTVSWFLNHESMLAWVPYGPQHRILLSLREQVRIDSNEFGTDSMPIQYIKSQHVLAAVEELQSAQLPLPSTWATSTELGFRCIF